MSRGAAPEQELDSVLIARDQVLNAREEAETRLRQIKAPACRAAGHSRGPG